MIPIRLGEDLNNTAALLMATSAAEDTFKPLCASSEAQIKRMVTVLNAKGRPKAFESEAMRLYGAFERIDRSWADASEKCAAMAEVGRAANLLTVKLLGLGPALQGAIARSRQQRRR